jgi:predicted amidohydrolase
VPLRVAAVQHDIVWEDRDATLARLEPTVAAAAAAGAQLVLLPETFAVGFSMDTARIAEPTDGPTADWLAAQAAAHALWIGGSVVERAAGSERPANVFVLAGPDGERHRYAKRHLFTLGGEAEQFVAGDESVTFAVGDVRVSPLVCFDLRFAPQTWAQAPATDLYVVVANWPTVRHVAWRALCIARAIENQAFLVGVNRVGAAGDGTAHAGGSIVVDPTGNVLAEADDTETTLLVDIDPGVVAEIRRKLPFLDVRR